MLNVDLNNLNMHDGMSPYCARLIRAGSPSNLGISDKQQDQHGEEANPKD